jgi:hypothetical protein
MSAIDAIEGLIGQISIGGTMIAFLTGVDFSTDRSQTRWRAMGTFNPTQILKGRRNFEGSVRRAYLCCEFLDDFMRDDTEFSAVIYPRGTAACGTIQGTIAFKTDRSIIDDYC